MNVRCNICLRNIDESEIESHTSTTEHKENKTKISKMIENGSNVSIVNAWHDMLQ